MNNSKLNIEYFSLPNTAQLKKGEEVVLDNILSEYVQPILNLLFVQTAQQENGVDIINELLEKMMNSMISIMPEPPSLIEEIA